MSNSWFARQTDNLQVQFSPAGWPCYSVRSHGMAAIKGTTSCITSANTHFASLSFVSFSLEGCPIEKVLRNTEVMIPSRTTER